MKEYIAPNVFIINVDQDDIIVTSLDESMISGEESGY